MMKTKIKNIESILYERRMCSLQKTQERYLKLAIKDSF